MTSLLHRSRSTSADPAYQAFLLLRTVFTVAPIAFGLDKFANVLTDWPTYLAPWIDDIVPGHGAAGDVRGRGRRDPGRRRGRRRARGSGAGWWPPGSPGSS